MEPLERKSERVLRDESGDSEDDEHGVFEGESDQCSLYFCLQVKFDDIFGEPDPEVFSMDSVWSMANKV